MTLTKKELVGLICDNISISKKKGCAIVDRMISALKNALCTDEDILISNFGKFSVKLRKERRNWNPITGRNMVLASRRTVMFKAAPRLRAKLNGGNIGKKTRKCGKAALRSCNPLVTSLRVIHRTGIEKHKLSIE
jgi:integration host factor subunit alpha